jgi:hypothetical protein
VTIKNSITIEGITYTELLATLPWVALLDRSQAMACHWGSTTDGRGKRCKVPARLRYVNIDGSVQHFCHHHLYDAKMAQHYSEPGEPGYEEVNRNNKWRERTTICEWSPQG